MNTNGMNLDRQALRKVLIGIAGFAFALGAQAGEPGVRTVRSAASSSTTPISTWAKRRTPR